MLQFGSRRFWKLGALADEVATRVISARNLIATVRACVRDCEHIERYVFQQVNVSIIRLHRDDLCLLCRLRAPFSRCVPQRASERPARLPLRALIKVQSVYLRGSHDARRRVHTRGRAHADERLGTPNRARGASLACLR
jgi:hypothetical protein